MKVTCVQMDMRLALTQALEFFCEDCSVYDLLMDLKKAEKYQ